MIARHARRHVAAENLDTEFVIMLEPDNTVHPNGITNPPNYDAGGLRDSNPRFGPPLVKFVEAQARKLPGKQDFKWWYHGTGLAGGSYFRTAAILDAFSDDAISKINWGHLLQFDSKRVFSSDFAMPIALSYAGYTYAPWSEIVQKDLPNQPLDGTWAFEHYGRGVQGGKPEYNRKLQPGQSKLYKSSPMVRTLQCTTIFVSAFSVVFCFFFWLPDTHGFLFFLAGCLLSFFLFSQ